MPRRGVKHEEDSESDWDSMSEIDPPPKIKGIQNSVPGPSQNQPAAKPRIVRPMTFVDPQLGDNQVKDDPPFDFKSEVVNPIKLVDELPPIPGKQRKGKAYEPHQGSQRHVSFVDEETSSQGKPTKNERMVKTDSDTEDPLYSTVKPKNASFDGRQYPLEDEHKGAENESSNRSKKKVPKMNIQPTKKLQGVENEGYVEDEQAAAAAANQFAVSDVNFIQSSIANPLYAEAQTLTKQRLPSRPPQNLDSHKRGIKCDASYLVSNTENHKMTSRGDTPPLILTVGESSVESAGKKSVEAISRTMGEAFALITFPFSCFILFLHHLLRFFLQGVIRPLLIDSLTLIVEYLVRPFMSSVVKPLLITLHGASVTLSDTLVVFIRPLTVVLQSVRLVEVNYIRRYSVEEV